MAAGLTAEAAEALEREAFRPIVWRSLWQRFFLPATSILASTILLKFGAIQWLELLYFAQIALMGIAFIRNDLRAVWFRPYLWLQVLYLLFMIAAVALAVASFRFTFYIPTNLAFFGYPGFITASRVLELFASTTVMLFLADLLRQEPAKLRLMMRLYFWTGVLSALYSYVSYPIDLAGLGTYGSYLSNHRFRGFQNEGGPYGVYLFTVFFVGFALYELRWEPLLRLRIGIALLPIAFYKSYSKASFMAVLALLAINVLFGRGVLRRVVLLAAIAVGSVVATRTLNLNPAKLLVAADSDSAAYERASHLHAGDGNYVYGRVAGLFIVPRMIAAHPLTGIGWGNYGVLRNDPQYRGASVWSDVADQPGLGILGYAAEFGIPLLSFLGVLLVLPYIYLRFRRCPTWMTNLALMSPLVHLFGAQLNVTYPWILTAFTLALGYAGTSQQKLHETEEPLQLSWTETATQ
jgi:hypothetical protein